MQRVQCLIVFLLCSFLMSAMELTLTTNNCSGLETIMDDFLTTMNRLPLNREVRDTLRCTSKKCLKFIFSQDELNEKYKEAYKNQNQYQMDRWRDLGGCFYYQEFANAVKNKKDKLAHWLLNKGKITVAEACCSNMIQAAKISAVDEMLPVIQWLLGTRTSSTQDSEFSRSFYGAIHLVKEYPEAKKFVELFDKYKDDELRRKLQERAIAQACSGMSVAACYGPTTGYYHFNQS